MSDVEPEAFILRQIFGDGSLVKTTIVLQNYEKCIFRVDIDDGTTQEVKRLVRIELVQPGQENRFKIIHAMQALAASFIPSLVPQTYALGTVKDSQGRAFNYSVSEFVEGSTLHDVWEQMNDRGQAAVVEQLGQVIRTLRSIRPTDVQSNRFDAVTQDAGNEIAQALTAESGCFGGPPTGFLSGPEFIPHIVEREKLSSPYSSIEPATTVQGIRVQSLSDDIDPVLVTKEDMESWHTEAVLCHNDLNPRNIIVRRTSDGEESEYRLAALIDWELAGFYPASYETSLLDTHLGGAHQQLSFYLMLKQELKNTTPLHPSQVSLAKTMELIYGSRESFLLQGNNISALIRDRFMKEFGLSRTDPYSGWTTQVDPKKISTSRQRLQAIEDDVIQEVIAKRKASQK